MPQRGRRTGERSWRNIVSQLCLKHSCEEPTVDCTWRCWTLPLLLFDRERMHLVYQVIFLNKILRNHLLSENMQWNYASSSVILNLSHAWDHGILRHIPFGARQLGAKYCQTLGNKPNHSHRVLRGRLFSYLILCFTKCTLFFQKVCFLLPICLPCVICWSYVTKINAVLWHSARQTFVSLCLFTFARIARLLQLWIKTSEFGRRPNKYSRTTLYMILTYIICLNIPDQ